jgi:hypothetical protein
MRTLVLIVTLGLSVGIAAQGQPGGGAPAGGQTPAAQGGGGQGRGGQGGGQGQGGGGQGRGGQGGRGGQANQPPPGPAPRNAGGRVLLGGATLKEKGLWLPVFGITAPLLATEQVPYQPWAKAIFVDRQKHELEPHARCKPSGFSREFMTPYGVEFVELPELQRVFIFDVGGPHTFRTIYMDGRSHPANLTPTYYGHSIGWWEGDSLVVDTVGFNESFWLDRRGMPHTNQLHTLERYTRTNQATIQYEVTVDDPGAYTKPWKSTFNLRWENGTELFEYVCQQANYGASLMVGDQESGVGTASAIVP